jgi:hypothetical protein
VANWSAKTYSWRGRPPGKSNLQVQRNVDYRPSTVAWLIVPDIYFFGIDGPDFANREAELTREIRRGLTESWKSWVATTEAGPRASEERCWRFSKSPVSFHHGDRRSSHRKSQWNERGASSRRESNTGKTMTAPKAPRRPWHDRASEAAIRSTLFVKQARFSPPIARGR